MSVNYASGLSEYEDKGKCGLPEQFEDYETLQKKVITLAKYIREAKHCVLFCGAGLSTSAGIPDFRGPNGVWTLEKKGLTLPEAKLKSFDKCTPTYSHQAIRALVASGLVHFVVSQNIDGLFLKANLPRANLAELHGNYFADQCTKCRGRFIRTRASPTMACRPTGDACPRKTPRRPCKGILTDTILDWEQALPEGELRLAERHSLEADLAICLGSTLQIEPAGSMPLAVFKKAPKQLKKVKNSKKRKHDDLEGTTNGVLQESTKPDGKLVIINLQSTRFDSKATLIIHQYIDRVMELLCRELDIQVPEYNPQEDPTKQKDLVEWKR